MQLKHLYFHSSLSVFIVLFLFAAPMNSYAENPLLILKEKLQESLLNALNTMVDDTVESEFGTNIDTSFKSVVPSLIGKTPIEAEQILRSHNLVLGKVIDRESSQVVGTIILQSQAVNTEISQNTAINVEVAIAIKASKKVPEVQTAKPTPPPPVTTPKLTIVLKLSRNKIAVGESLMLQAVVQPIPSKHHNLRYTFTIDGKMIPSKIAKVSYEVKKTGRVIVTASVREGSGKWLHSKSQWLTISAAKNNPITDKTDNNTSDKNTAQTADKNPEKSVQSVAAIAAAEQAANAAAEEKIAEEYAIKIAQEQAAAQAAELSNVNEAAEKEEEVNKEKEAAAALEVRIKIPNVVGLPLADAERILDKANLRVGSINTKASIGLSLILQQIPNAGQQVKVDSVVNLVQAIKPEFSFELSVDRTQIKQQEQLTFKGVLTPTDIDTTVRYRLTINDQSQQSDQPIWNHTFDKAGNYRVIAEAIVEGDSIYRSTPINIHVSPIWQVPQAQIEPSTLIVTQGDIATFSSRSRHDKKTSLALYWMDESGGNSEADEYRIDTQTWQAGEYWVSLRIKDDQGLEHSDKAQLIVMAENTSTTNVSGDNTTVGLDQPKLFLSTPNYHTTAGKPLPFTLKQQPESKANIRYRFHFGDGEILETSRLWASHRYAKLGRYHAFVETIYQKKIIRSKIIKIWVWPSWFLVGITGMGLLILAGLMKLFLYRTRWVVKTKDSHIDYIAVPDMGEQRLEIKSRASQNKTRVTFNSSHEKDQ